jgi:hypothetical protein
MYIFKDITLGEPPKTNHQCNTSMNIYKEDSKIYRVFKVVIVMNSQGRE